MDPGHVRMWDIARGKPLTPADDDRQSCRRWCRSAPTESSFTACDRQHGPHVADAPRPASSGPVARPGNDLRTTAAVSVHSPSSRRGFASGPTAVMSVYLDGALAYNESGEIVMARQAASLRGRSRSPGGTPRTGRLLAKHRLPETARDGSQGL